MNKFDLRYSVDSKNVKRLEDIWNRLIKFLPKSYHSIQLGLVFTSVPDVYDTFQGGYACDSTINIGTEYLNLAEKDIAIAEILAHELGHHVLGHVNRRGEGEIHPCAEQDADHFGLMLCELAGFSRNEYVNWFEEFENRRASTLSEKHIREHGTGSDRVKKLRLQNTYLNELENF
jgi:hypothetical protein